MTRVLLAAVLAGGLAVVPGAVTARPRDDGPKPDAKAPAARIVNLLDNEPAKYAGDIQTDPLVDVLRNLAKQFDLTFIIDKTAFEKPDGVIEAKAARLIAARLEGLTLGRFLEIYLRALDVPEGVTYLVREDHIEITSPSRAPAAQKGEGGAKGDAAKAASFDPAAAKIVNVLHNQPVRFNGDLQTTPLADVLRSLSKTYDLNFVIDNSAFENPAGVADAKATQLHAARLEGLTLGRFLDIYLRALPVAERATYLVRDYGIEITSREKAAVEAGLTEAAHLADAMEEPGANARAQARLNLPLVSVVVEDRPLGEVLKELARAYNLNLVIDRLARNRVAEEAVMARLLNVPADTALELLAEQAGLEVVRKGNTFRITGGNGAQ